jgi:hypothetical protein
VLAQRPDPAAAACGRARSTTGSYCRGILARLIAAPENRQMAEIGLIQHEIVLFSEILLFSG